MQHFIKFFFRQLRDQSDKLPRAWFQKVKGVVSVNYDRIYQLNSTAPGPQ